jgi:hypothetical protein
MKTRFTIMLILISALVLGACQGAAKPSASSGNTPAPRTTNKTPLPPPASATQAPAVAPTQAPSGDNGNPDLADIPVLPDAKNNSSSAGVTTYNSATGFDDTVNFYKTQMTTNGWTADPASSMSSPNFALITFNKDKRIVSIQITFDNDKKETTVGIAAG